MKNLSTSIKNLEDLQILSKQTLFHTDLGKILKYDENATTMFNDIFLKNHDGTVHKDLCRTIRQAQPNSLFPPSRLEFNITTAAAQGHRYTGKHILTQF